MTTTLIRCLVILKTADYFKTSYITFRKCNLDVKCIREISEIDVCSILYLIITQGIQNEISAEKLVYYLVVSTHIIKFMI